MWEEVYQQAFELLLDKMCNASVLRIPQLAKHSPSTLMPVEAPLGQLWGK